MLGLALSLLTTSQAGAFEAFDGRLQAHGFYEMQLRALNADYSEDWDVTQWYHVFNLELELDLIQDSIGILDLLSAYVRAEVRYDCIYSRGCGMFRSMNTYGNRSKSLPRRLSNATSQTNSGEIPLRNEGRVSESTTDPVPLSDVSGFSGVAETDGSIIVGSRLPCDTNPATRAGNRPGVNCFPEGLDGIRPFDYIFERFTGFRFSMVNVKGGSGSGNPIQLLGPWLPKNRVETTAVMADRVNPFDSSRLNPVLRCNFQNQADNEFGATGCPNYISPGGGARPFRPIPIFAEDVSSRRVDKIRVVVYLDESLGLAGANPNDPSTYRIIEVTPQHNQGDARFNGGKRDLLMRITDPIFPGDTSASVAALTIPQGFPVPIGGRYAYDVRDLELRRLNGKATPLKNFRLPITGDFSNANPFNSNAVNDSNVTAGVSAGPRTEFFNGRLTTTSTETQARGLFVPSPPLRRILQEGKVDTNWPLNLSQSDRAWNRGLAQRDEKELKEAYLDIELFDSRLWMRIGKQQIVWGKTELFRTTDQFNPQDLALATLPSLEESRIALWSARGVWSLYEVGPLEDVRLEVAVNIDDYQSSDFGSCGEPYVVNLVCTANFGAFAHGFTGIGIVGIEAPPDPWQSTKGWEIGGRIEWRWDRFSFAVSDFWGFADLPAVRRVSTYERNVDPQTGRPLIYQGGVDPALRRTNLSVGFARDTNALWQAIGRSDDPWEDPFGDLRALVAAQQADPGGVMAGRVPGGVFSGTPGEGFARNPRVSAASAGFVVRGASRISCGSSRGATATNPNGIRVNFPGNPDGAIPSDLDPGVNCLTAGPTRLRTETVNLVINGVNVVGTRQPDRNLAAFQPACLDDNDGDGIGETYDPTNPGCIYRPTNALDSHHANLTFFTWLCSATVGFLELDRTSCAQTVFGSTEEAAAGLSVASVIGRILGGDPTLNTALSVNTNTTCVASIPLNRTCQQPANKGSRFLPYALPIVQLSNDPGDLDSMNCTDFGTRDFTGPATNAQEPCGGTPSPIRYLSATLSPEQEALLGCGPFWGTQCDISGVDLLNMEPSIVLQSFAGASGTLDSIRLKQNGVRPPGTFALNPLTGLPEAFKDVNEYRTDEGLQPGTLPWEVSGIGGPLCSTTDIGGNPYPRGSDTIQVPTGSAARPPTRKEALPGCHRKWVDRVDGYINPAWGAARYQVDASGNLIFDPVTGLPRQARDGAGRVIEDYAYYSGDPDPLGVVGQSTLSYPDAVLLHSYSQGTANDLLFSVFRPGSFRASGNLQRQDGPGQPFAGRRAVAAGPGVPGRPRVTVPFASELAGFSWNFQILAVAFSNEFSAALETVGDLADPVRTPCGGVNSNGNPQTICGANVEGGSIPVPIQGSIPNALDPNTIGHNKRIVAQMLYGYCGSEYGTGSCRIDGNTNQVLELAQLYTAAENNPASVGLNQPTFSRNNLADTQALQNSLQFLGVPIVRTEDATLDLDEFETNPVATGEFNVITSQHCSFITPQHCSTVQNLFFLAGLKRNTINAGGNGKFGRRTMQWHSGGEIVLYVPKRNVLGFAMDFAEDRSKSNFSIETTWIENVPTGDVDEFDGTRHTDEFNLTVSVDRPTFVNFINPNRTLFINSQWFFQYRRGTKKGFQGTGPFNALATLTVFTGYFQDRLNPSVTFVHDIQSGSGGLLPSINYRFSENFSATIGAAWFYGREQRADIATNGIGPAGNEAGDWAYQTGAQNGIAIARDRDEIYLRLRYTF